MINFQTTNFDLKFHLLFDETNREYDNIALVGPVEVEFSKISNITAYRVKKQFDEAECVNEADAGQEETFSMI